jgi:hypothetical protein
VSKTDSAIFARWTFRLAGIYGVLVIPPMYFMERQIAIDSPPTITHPEFFYGFVGVTLAWQLAFLVMSLDPQRYRLLMLPAIVETFTFTAATTVLFLQQRLAGTVFLFGILDFVLGVLFAISFVKTANRRDGLP